MTVRNILTPNTEDRLLDSCIPVNIWIIRILGLDAALMLGKLINQYNYLISIGRLYDTFTLSTSSAQKYTGLGKTRQKKAIKALCDYGIIDYSVGGLPSKRYFSFRGDFDYTKLDSDIERLKLEDEQSIVKIAEKHDQISEKISAWRDKKRAKEIDEMISNIDDSQITNPYDELPF